MKSTGRVALSGLVIFALFGIPGQAQITRVVNGASFAGTSTFSPGTIIAIKGNNLANTTAAAQDPTKPPTTLGGVTVTVGGVASVIFYASPKQVNARIDPAVTLGMKQLVVSSPAGTYSAQIEIVKAGAGGIFSLPGTGTRDGAILNAITFALGPFSVTTAGQPTYLSIYTTGLDLSAKPRVTIDGIELPVLFAGDAPGFAGLQQINVQLLPQLAGAGRVEVAVTAGAKTTNVVEIVILPSKGQVAFAPDEDNKERNRELAAIAWVPGTSLALLTDENDDVVRVIDIKARKVIRTIALPSGAQPSAVAVESTGKTAVVAERDRNRIAIIDLAANKVSEVTVGGGPSAVAISGNLALVLNLDTDNVSIVNIESKTVIATVEAGKSPRGISGDVAGGTWRAYVTNQSDGTISVIDVAQSKALAPINLGADVRPQSILVLPGTGFAVVTEPSRNQDGRALLVNLATGAIAAEVNTNPDKSGGSSEIAMFGDTIYFNNQSAGTVTAAKVVLAPTPSFTPRTIKAGLGPRAMAVDLLDKLLLVTTQGSGEVVLIDLTTDQIAGRINGVRAEDEDDSKHDDRDDRSRAANAPVISSLTPARGRVGTSFQLTISGSNLGGATEVAFIDLESAPGSGRGQGAGRTAKKDNAFTVTSIQVNTAGTQLTANVALAAGAKKGERLVQVFSPNGESTFRISTANRFEIE